MFHNLDAKTSMKLMQALIAFSFDTAYFSSGVIISTPTVKLRTCIFASIGSRFKYLIKLKNLDK